MNPAPAFLKRNFAVTKTIAVVRKKLKIPLKKERTAVLTEVAKLERLGTKQMHNSNRKKSKILEYFEFFYSSYFEFEPRTQLDSKLKKIEFQAFSNFFEFET